MRIVAIDTETGREFWTATQCAEHCEISRSTFAAYATRGTAPSVAEHFDARTPLWDAEEVRPWHRPHLHRYN
ncbi:hypothetical protein F7232_04675 [Corynebacterium sp. 319]|nr:hypothetical protein F7232_04675 [Corynebacterium sp. 319]KAB3539996.1 hypothetical protein F8390_01655 [Corynebacterium sp. 366]